MDKKRTACGKEKLASRRDERMLWSAIKWEPPLLLCYCVSLTLGSIRDHWNMAQQAYERGCEQENPICKKWSPKRDSRHTQLCNRAHVAVPPSWNEIRDKKSTFFFSPLFRKFFRLFLLLLWTCTLFYSMHCELLHAFAIQVGSYNCEQLDLIQIFYTFRCN